LYFLLASPKICGKFIFNKGMARRGTAWHGVDRPGEARQAKGKHMTPEEFKERITGLGWSQAAFARKTGLTANTVSQWVTGTISRVPEWVDAYLNLAESVKKSADLIKK
jgi:hypothetical protein